MNKNKKLKTLELYAKMVESHVCMYVCISIKKKE